MDLKFEFAGREDTSEILEFIRLLADYEHMLDEVVADEKLLEHWLFDEKKAEVQLSVAVEGWSGGALIGTS